MASKRGSSDKTRPPTNLATVGRKEWFRLVKALQANGSFERVDMSTITSAAWTLQKLREAETDVEEGGMYRDGPNGAPMLNPALKAVAMLQRQYAGFMDKLRLSNAKRVGKPKNTTADDLMGKHPGDDEDDDDDTD